MTTDIKIAGWAGIAGPTFGVGAILLTGKLTSPFPMWEWSTSEIYSYFTTADPLAVRTQYFLIGVAIALMPVFAAGLTQILQQYGGTTAYTRLLVPVAAAISVNLLAANAIWWVAAERGFSPELTRFAVEVVAVWMLHPTTFAMALITFSAGMAMRACLPIPRWLTVTTFAVAVLCAASVFLVLARQGWLSPFHWASMASYGIYLAWSAVTAVALLLNPATRTHTPEDSVATFPGQRDDLEHHRRRDVGDRHDDLPEREPLT